MKKTDKITPHRGQINYIDFHYRLSVSHEQARREFSKENYELIKKYDSVLLASSVAISTRSNYANWLVMMMKLLKKNWADITKEDVDDLVVNIMKNHGNHKGQESASTNSLKNALKAFVRWIKLDSRSFKKVGDPPETKSIVVKPVHNTLQKENLVTDKDRANMITACTGNLRNQAFIDVICDAGPRAGEILTLQLKHVKRDKYGIILAVDGKTGPHPIRLVKSIGRLTQWLNSHPFADDSEAPLWIVLKSPRLGQPFLYDAASAMIRKACKDGKVEKKYSCTFSGILLLQNQLNT